MLKKISTLFFLTLAVSAFPSKSGNVSFALAGDSTTATQGGWGDGFCSLVKNGTCFNGGHNGATTVSFVEGGYWNSVIQNLKTFVDRGDKTFVTIQFGHNDQKPKYNITLGTFASNLTYLANQVISAGGHPVIVTSLTRRAFASNGTLLDTLEPWAETAISVAKKLQIPYLDLHKKSMKYVQAIGFDAAQRFNMVANDTTHLNSDGKIIFSRIVADLLTKKVPGLRYVIASNHSLSEKISKGEI
ncbi:hypothetical protein HK096_009035, partial [Nowakowskiella sp. JEL0078]